MTVQTPVRNNNRKEMIRVSNATSKTRTFHAPDFIDPYENVAVWIGADCAIEVHTRWLGSMTILLDQAGWFGRIGRMPEEMAISVIPHERNDGEPYVHPMFDIKDLNHRHTMPEDRKRATTLWRLFWDTIAIEEPVPPMLAVDADANVPAKRRSPITVPANEEVMA